MNTPTPRTETDLFEATKVSLEYGNQRLLKKSQSTRIVGEVAFSDGYEYALKHSSKIKQLERELAAVTEQRDGLRSSVDYASDQLTRVTEQRDRLAEAIEHTMKHMRHSLNCPARLSEGLHACNCQMEWSYDNAAEALQSLNQATP